MTPDKSAPPEGVWTDVSPAELMAKGLISPGPLAPAMDPNPLKTIQNIREFINPAITPINPLNVAGKVHDMAGAGLGKVAGALGGLNLGGAMMSPGQRDLRARQLGNQFRDIGEAAMVPWAKAVQTGSQIITPFRAALTRTLQSAILGGMQKGMEGGGLGQVFGSAALSAGLQGALEAPAKLVRVLASSRVGQKMLTDFAAKYKDALGSFEARSQFDREFVDELNQLRSQGLKEQAKQVSTEYAQKAFAHKVQGQQMTADWERRVTQQKTLMDLANDAYMNKSAQNIVQVWDERVPVWKGMPQTVEGLIDRVYGKGQPLLRESFDTSLKEIVSQAEGKMIKVPGSLADSLDLLGGPLPAGTSGKGGPGGLLGDGSDMAIVDAAALAKAVLGKKSQLDPELYHEAAGILTQNGLGNAAANAEYASGMALHDIMEKTQALKYVDKPQLFMDKLLGGLTQAPKLKSLQSRTGDDALRGVIADQRAGMPQAPPEIPKPVQAPLEPKPTLPVEPIPIKYDPTITPPENPSHEDLLKQMGLTERTMPGTLKASSLGAGLGAAVGGLMGGGGGHFGTGGVVGAGLAGLLSHLIGPKVITNAPLRPAMERILATGPAMEANIIRAILSNAGEVSADDLAEIRAAQAQGQTAQDNPALQLGLDPSETR